MRGATTRERRGTDFLAACQTTQSTNKALEEVRDKGSEVLLAMFRLAKNALVHAIDNDAVTKTAAQTHRIVTDFGATVGGYVSITFVEGTIFVCGQLLRASRMIYESATEFGRLLARCGASEITLTADVTIDDLLKFATELSIAARDPEQRGRLLAAEISNMTVRQVDSTLQRDDEGSLPIEEQILRLYATALVVMRRYYDKLARGRMVMPHKVKRIAQRIVSLSDSNEGALLAMTTMANAHRDDAGRAVQSAILSVVITRRLTDNRVILAQIAMSALLADSGRVRLTGAGAERLTALTEDAEATIPQITSAIAISTGGVNVQSALRTVTMFETTFTEHERALGPVYKRLMSPTVQSRVLRVVRALLELLAPRDTSRPMSPLDALAKISKMPNIDPIAYKLLVAAIGVMPVGSVIEFDSGEWGIVIGPSSNPMAISLPRIKLLTDRSGQPFPTPKEIDLGRPEPGRTFPRIKGVVEPSKARFNVTAALLKGPA